MLLVRVCIILAITSLMTSFDCQTEAAI